MKLWFRHVVFSWNRTSDQSLIILYRWEATKNSSNKSKVTRGYGTYTKLESNPNFDPYFPTKTETFRLRAVQYKIYQLLNSSSYTFQLHVSSSLKNYDGPCDSNSNFRGTVRHKIMLYWPNPFNNGNSFHYNQVTATWKFSKKLLEF